MDIRKRFLFSGRYGSVNGSQSIEYQVLADTDDQSGRDIAEAKAKALFEANEQGWVLLTPEQIAARVIPENKAPSDCYIWGGVHPSGIVFD